MTDDRVIPLGCAIALPLSIIIRSFRNAFGTVARFGRVGNKRIGIGRVWLPSSQPADSSVSAQFFCDATPTWLVSPPMRLTFSHDLRLTQAMGAKSTALPVRVENAHSLGRKAASEMRSSELAGLGLRNRSHGIHLPSVPVRQQRSLRLQRKEVKQGLFSRFHRYLSPCMPIRVQQEILQCSHVPNASP